MAAPCGSGTGTPNTGTTAVIKYSAGAVALALAEVGEPWMLPLVPLFSFTDEVLSTLCSAALPAMPTFTAAEAKALLNLTFGTDFASGLAKLPDLLTNIVWNDNCHCVGGALVPIVFPSPPSGVAVVTTPVTQQPSKLCATVSGSDTRTLPVGAGYSSVNLVGQGACTGGYLGNGFLLPQGATYVRVTFHNTVSGAGPTDSFSFVTRFASGTNQTSQGVGATVGGFDTTVASGVTTVIDYAIPLLADRVYVCNSFVAHSNTTNVSSVTVDIYCGGPPGTTPQPCCPPDTSTQSLLDSILRMVTLIQRQSVPFAYVPGTVHAGRSGAGVIGVSGLIGAKIDVTTLPTSYGQRGTSPTEIFDLGWISWGTSDGYPSSFRLEHDPQLSLPPRCSAFTDLAYELAPGVVITITELLREP